MHPTTNECSCLDALPGQHHFHLTHHAYSPLWNDVVEYFECCRCGAGGIDPEAVCRDRKEQAR